MKVIIFFIFLRTVTPKEVEMNRLLYESSVSYKGYLIIPFIFGQADNYEIYSYKLLSEIGHKNQFHKSENPAKIYGSGVSNIVDIAKEHIEQNSELVYQGDSFKSRYIYRNHLIIIFQERDKCFYDHYPPELLNNIAAPKLFKSEYECLSWIKQGLDGRQVRQRAN